MPALTAGDIFMAPLPAIITGGSRGISHLYGFRSDLS